MKLSHVLAAVLADLPDDVREIVRARVRFESRPLPVAEDLERGATADMAGYFYGHQVGAGDDEAELELEEGEDTAAPAGHQPGGVIVLFTGNIHPLTAEAVTEVLLHEIAHFLGDDEDDVGEAGLSEFDEDQVMEIEEQ